MQNDKQHLVNIEKVEYHFHNHIDLEEVMSQLNTIKLKLKIMGANTDKALQDLASIKSQLTKVSTETTTLLEKITALEDAAANADTPQSVLDAIAEVKAQAQTVDDQVADAPTEPPVEPPTEG